jgi:non-ribosomal peptide synthetase component F
MLAAFQTLLFRYTGQSDILVDTGVGGRDRAQLSALIGFFLNSVILRTDLSGDPTFSELLSRVKRVCLGALEHHEIPFDRVVSALGGERTSSGSLTPVSFNLQEMPAKQRDMGGGVRLSPWGSKLKDEFDLTMYVFLSHWCVRSLDIQPRTVRTQHDPTHGLGTS